MNVENLRNNYPKLIAFMENEGYYPNYVYKVWREIQRILNMADKKAWRSYSDVYEEYAKRLRPSEYLRHKRTFLGIIEHFEVYEQYPDRRRRQKVARRDKYPLLTDEFKAVIDYYCAAEQKRGKKDSTIYTESHNAATFLYTLQEKGVVNLQSITEEAVLSVFVEPDGKLRRGCSYKKNVTAVFKACIPQAPEMFERILAFLPALRTSRKNIQYLLPEETSAIKQVLTDASSPLSLRDRAVGILALYTGLRCCDIAGMKLESVDLENDLIFIGQQKTDIPLELPLTAVVGNAIYDYVTLERPQSKSEYIFISEDRPHKRLKSSSLGNIARRLMAAAGIRQVAGDRVGFHIFRHRVATELLGNGIARPVISQILGHDSPDSLDAYLSTDFVHLKECAISIERFPASGEVFSNE
jgi:integrase